jgi:hypothetical protein
MINNKTKISNKLLTLIKIIISRNKYKINIKHNKYSYKNIINSNYKII